MSDEAQKLFDEVEALLNELSAMAPYNSSFYKKSKEISEKVAALETLIGNDA